MVIRNKFELVKRKASHNIPKSSILGPIFFKILLNVAKDIYLHLTKLEYGKL